MRAVKEKLAEIMDATPKEIIPKNVIPKDVIPKDIIPKDIIIDAPPGVSCPAINAVMDSDLIILVTEPTPFGFYDMKLAHEAFKPMGKPMGVVINRAGLGNSDVYDYCNAVKLEILAEIPYDRKVAEAYANGSIISESSDEMKQIFMSLADKIKEKAGPNGSRKKAGESSHG